MTREQLQNWALFLLVAALLFAVVRIHQAFQSKVPLNLEGNIAVEGAMTANPPAP